MLGRVLTIFVQSVKNDLRRIEKEGKLKQQSQQVLPSKQFAHLHTFMTFVMIV